LTLVPLLLLALFATLSASGTDFEIISPKEKALYTDAFASVSVKLDYKKVTKLEVYHEGNLTRAFNTGSSRDFYCSSVRLHLGNNHIVVKAYDGNVSLGEKRVDLYYSSEVFEDFYEEPYGYKKRFFHDEKSESVCVKCHDMDRNFNKLDKKTLKAKGAATADIEILENPQESSCYTCHNNLVSRKNGHSPSVNFACVACHTGEAGENNLDEDRRSRYIQPDPIASRCFMCHERLKEIVSHNNSDHGPAKSGRCNKCHNPHSSDNLFFLRKPIWELCTTCHSEKITERHVITSFVFRRNKNGHPTRKRPDPSRPGRELVCSSCHNPHGSKGPFLLRTDQPTPFSVCKRCHDK